MKLRNFESKEAEAASKQWSFLSSVKKTLTEQTVLGLLEGRQEGEEEIFSK